MGPIRGNNHRDGLIAEGLYSLVSLGVILYVSLYELHPLSLERVLGETAWLAEVLSENGDQ